MKNSDGKFKAPVAGYYRVASTTYRYRPIDEWYWAPNLNKSWYEFWKPSLVYTQKWEQYETLDGQEVRYLNAGELVEFPLYERLK